TIDVAIAQSDVFADAIRGEGAFSADGPMPNLRLVLAAHDEPFTIVARTDIGIVSSADLAGKRVNIGDIGSGHRVMMERLLRASGLARSDFAAALELGPGSQVQALCEGRVDAIVYSVGHPNGLIQEAIRSCGGRLIPVVEDRIREIVASHSEYAPMSIPGGVYRENWADTPTFGTRAMVVTIAEASAPAIRHLVQSVIENVDEFQRLHLAFARLDPRRMAMRPDFAAFHPGAESYLRERGLVQ
ncbi:MAG TPA: TAXI family TRAP transporter solute-binding subunit, partial [Alphaproteobacteria bacterium]|nr:TAXI family TRAP transporter solute-binding subunit [Alphaproteobacteria bacterium]